MQITTGIRSILSAPMVYSAFQYLMGADAFWKSFVKNTLNLGSHDLILDIGCGPADILDYLPLTTHYWGFDISQEYIQKAQLKYGDRGNFFCKFFEESDLPDLPKFDRIILTGVLHHMDDNEAIKVLTLAQKALKLNGVLVTVDPCLCEKQNPIARFLILKDRGQNVRSEPQYKQLLQESFNMIQTNVVHKAWVPYTHCFMVASK